MASTMKWSLLCLASYACMPALAHSWNPHVASTVTLASTYRTDVGATQTPGPGASAAYPPRQDRVEHAIQVVNNCDFDVWPAMQSNKGSVTMLMTDYVNGSKLSSCEKSPWIPFPQGWAGRIWGRTICAFRRGQQYDVAAEVNRQCVTGDCSGLLECGKIGATGATTFAEIAFDSGDCAMPRNSIFDVSAVDGHNLPMAWVPLNCDGTGASQSDVAQAIGCATPANEFECPLASTVMFEGQTVACLSGCGTTNSSQTCCTEANGCPWSCPPTDWSLNFKRQCPRLYSYAYDDETTLYSCVHEASYQLVFCPQPSDIVNQTSSVYTAGVPWQDVPPASEVISSQTVCLHATMDGGAGFPGVNTLNTTSRTARPTNVCYSTALASTSVI